VYVVSYAKYFMPPDIECAYDDTLSSYHFRSDEDCIAWFVQQLRDLAHRVKNIIGSANIPIETLSKEQWETIARRVVIFARNRSRRTTHGYAIIAVSPVDTAV